MGQKVRVMAENTKLITGNMPFLDNEDGGDDDEDVDLLPI